MNTNSKPEFGQNQQIPMPTIHQGGSDNVQDPNQYALPQSDSNNVKPSDDSDVPGAEFGLDVNKNV